MIRVGSIVILEYEPLCDAHSRVGKVICKVTRNEIDYCILKLHYNGQLFVSPVEYLRRPTKEERNRDKRNDTYWRSEPNISIVNAVLDEYPTYYNC
jgi:hypothetical protein